VQCFKSYNKWGHWSFVNSFLYGVRHGNSFYMLIPSFPNTTYWVIFSPMYVFEDFLENQMSIVVWANIRIFIVFHWSTCLFLCHYHTICIIMAPLYNLKACIVITLTLFFLLRIALPVQGFYASLWILGFFFYFREDWHWNFDEDFIKSLHL
jgi:hypothetical protein